MRIFIMVILLFIVGCSSVNYKGEYCSKDDYSECKAYVPLYTPLKLFVSSIGD